MELRYAWYIARVGEKMDECKFLARKPLGRRLLRRITLKCILDIVYMMGGDSKSCLIADFDISCILLQTYFS
jgi:hypothetical protein